MKINCRLNSVKKKDGVQKNKFVKNWTVSSLGDLLRKTDTTNSISRKPVADGRDRWAVGTEQNTVSSSLQLNWYEVRKTTLGPAKVPDWEILKSWQEYPAVLCDESWVWMIMISRTECAPAVLGQPRPTTHQQSRWSVVTTIKSSS